MNNKISNTKVEVPRGIKLNDKDYINCLLSTLKEMSKNYTIALTEASNENLYNMYYDMLDNINELQRKAYELMFRKGWYCLEKAEEIKINNKLNTLTEEYNNLNNSN